MSAKIQIHASMENVKTYKAVSNVYVQKGTQESTQRVAGKTIKLMDQGDISSIYS